VYCNFVGGSEMKEYIIDLISLGELDQDELDGGGFADHGCIQKNGRNGVRSHRKENQNKSYSDEGVT
jgi:hypothetical protein